MMKFEVKAALDAKFERVVGDDEEWTEIFSYLYKKFDLMPEEAFSQCSNFTNIRSAIHEYKIKSSRKNSSKKTYCKLEAPIDEVTEKAYGIITGSNNLSGTNYKEYVSWIPTSQVIEEDSKVYVPNWLISNNNMWGFVNKNDKITR
ncbi:hypothetical protein [Paenibacillus pini]|uniref:hypothetical protein n=1 Tax=Paenibacillus pini TaxID=669461 RepID=UPI00055C7904|nr:hypothetical protein [Paenibacillus pini]